MNDSSVFVGLDYHQASVQVCVMDRQGEIRTNRRCPNDLLAIVEAVRAHGTAVQAAVEACAGAADLAEALITQGGWSVSLAHPGYVRRMKQNPDKSDYTDARMLADLVRVGYLPRVWLAPQNVRELRRLVRYRQQLADERRNLKLRIQALLRDQRVRFGEANCWTKPWLHWLGQTDELTEQSRWIIDRQLRRLKSVLGEIGEVERHLEQVTTDDPLVHSLQGQAGIGPVTAWTLRAEIGRFDRFRHGKQLARFCGLSPRNASSGARQADAGLIKAANGRLRATLIEAAQRLMRHDDRWRRFGNRLRDRGKPYCVVVAAVANRWIRWLFHPMSEVSEAELAA